MNKKTTLKGIL